MRSSNPIAVVVLCVGLLVGCASKDKSDTSKEAAAPTAKTKFDTAKEPTISADTRFAAGQLAESRRVGGSSYVIRTRRY